MERSWELETYRKIGGYEAWERILREKPRARGDHRGSEGLRACAAAAARAFRPA